MGQVNRRFPSRLLFLVHLCETYTLVLDFGKDFLLCRPGLVRRLAVERVELSLWAHRRHDAAQFRDGHVLLPRVPIYFMCRYMGYRPQRGPLNSVFHGRVLATVLPLLRWFANSDLYAYGPERRCIMAPALPSCSDLYAHGPECRWFCTSLG
jgi:hypothetical protein